MHDMFDCCSSLTSLSISSFDTSNVTDMSEMFRNCISLKTLDLSSFNMKSVKNKRDMFEGCDSNIGIPLGTNIVSMFQLIKNWFLSIFHIG